MMGDPLSVVLLPTLKCNAACDYCFEDKINIRMTHEELDAIVRKLTDYMSQQGIGKLLIYWQGGEIMVMPPVWFEEADGIIARAAADSGKKIVNYLQSNMVGYSPKWNSVVDTMFGNSIGTSMDYPNLYRRFPGREPEQYSKIWQRNVRQALDADIHIGLISIPNEESFRLGAERFYSHVVDELGINDFQVNLPFPGGKSNAVKLEYPLNVQPLVKFMVDLFEVWMERGYGQGVKLGPFDYLLNHFLEGDPGLPCIWRSNCANELLCVDPKGNISQCDCWVASYPEYSFGNVFEYDDLKALLSSSKPRQDFLERPGVLVQQEDCGDCEYLSICHGGCPVRAYSICGTLFKKDPYCEVYKAMFRCAEQTSTNIAAQRSVAAG